jgi:hypothetical protein
MYFRKTRIITTIDFNLFVLDSLTSITSVATLNGDFIKKQDMIEIPWE